MFAAAAACRRRYNVWTSPVVIIFLWWSGWLVVALEDFIGIPAPSLTLVTLVLTALVFFLGGAFSGSFRPGYVRDRSPSDEQVASERVVKFWLVVCLLIAVPVLKVFSVGASQVAVVGDLSSYRADALGGLQGKSTLYGQSAAFEIFYGSIVSPLLFGALLWVIARGWRRPTKERVLFGLVALLVMLDSFAKFGRTTLYFFLLASIFAARFRANRSGSDPTKANRSKKTRRLLSFGALGALVALLAILSYYRLGRHDITLSETLGYFAVWYHTAGFALLDSELIDRASHLNSAVTYGLASIGGVYNYCVYAFHVLGVELPSVARDNGILHNDFVKIGYSDKLNVPIFSNAYYTVLYSVFQDFRWIGVAVLSFFFGFVVNGAYARFVTNGRDSRLYLIILYLYLGLFGIFQSPLESPMFWVPLIAGLILERRWAPTANRPAAPGTLFHARESRDPPVHNRISLR
ncbi:MAG: O-antigen polymerase [Gemmatimonadaceae bacterium]